MAKERPEELGNLALIGISLVEAIENSDHAMLDLLDETLSPEERETALLSVISLSFFSIQELTGATPLEIFYAFRQKVAEIARGE